MSVEPQALERSVLERKERDELQAIAEALGLKPGSRARKGDLVDQILREAGVETPPSGEGPSGEGPSGEGASGEASGDAAKPKRTRRTKATEADPAPGDAGEAVPPADPTGNGRPASDSGVTALEGGAADALTEAIEESPPNGQVRDATDTSADQEPGRGSRGGGEPAASGEEGSSAPTTTEPRPQGGDRQDRGPRDRPRDRAFEGPGGGEPGNRRSRRRRGRDRERGDFAGQERPEQPYTGELITVEGLLDLNDQGYGFLRTGGYLAGAKDVYVSISQVRRFALRKGDYVEGGMRPAGSNEKYPALVRIDTVSGLSPDDARNRSRFEELTPLFPDEKLRLETPADPSNVQARIIDLISPIGKGQRGLIVSPPKAGKTTVMKQIARSIETNNPETHVMVLLVDERPEEVTDWRKWMKGENNEVVASTFDRPSDEHTQVAELAIERAKRLVEMGRDVVIVLDGITRLARAYNLAAPASGRILSGGVDSGALYPPKKFFGAARNIEEGGSLTILATALVETGSRMDEVIFEEFKGTGNMELRLDRKLAERRIYPAIDVNASSTRHEELLFERKQLEMVWRLRRVLNGLAEGGSTAAGLELLLDKLKTTKSNDEFLAEIAKAPAVG